MKLLDCVKDFATGLWANPTHGSGGNALRQVAEGERTPARNYKHYALTEGVLSSSVGDLARSSSEISDTVH